MMNKMAAMTKTAAPFQNSGSRYLERRFIMAKFLRGYPFLRIALDQKGGHRVSKGASTEREMRAESARFGASVKRHLGG